MSSDATFVAAKVRLRKKRIGSIGASARSSQRTKPTTSDGADRERERRSRGSTSPGRCRGRGPRRCRAGRALTRPRPGRSSLLDGPCVSSRRRSASGISTRPIGTLSQKIHCQERPETTAPPTSGPSATARPPIPPQAPSASPRFSAGTAAERIVSVSGSDDRAADALERAGGDERVDRRRERGRRRGDREDPEPDREHPPAAEAVAERGAGQEEHREGERVGVHRPLEPLDAGVRGPCGSRAARS